jgi:hypothetical protein
MRLIMNDEVWRKKLGMKREEASRVSAASLGAKLNTYARGLSS